VRAHHASYVLPNGLEIWHQNKAETDHFYEDIFAHRTYVRHLAAWPQGGCVFDVGSNIGLFTLFVHTLDPSAKIYAFEPSAPTFEVLRHNVTHHGVNATLFEAGLSDADKTVELTFYPYSSGMTSVYGNHDEELAVLRGIIENQAQANPASLGQVIDHADELYRQRLVSQTLPCQLRTLSSVIRDHAIERIDLLKIDVQKSELDVLRGIAPGDWRKIAAIAIEVHDLAGRLDEIAQLLTGHGYRVESVQDELYRGTGIYLLYATR
jgi:FkbM family methyltransferase